MAPLLVLWLLSERSSYGYEIKKALTDRGMAFWFGLADASIYSALRTLERNGHVCEVGVEQDGARPPRLRYAITPEGREHYRELLIAAVSTVRLPIAPIDVVLAADGDLPPAVLEAALERRRTALEEMRTAVDEHRRSVPSAAIPERVGMLLDAEADWLEHHTSVHPAPGGTR